MNPTQAVIFDLDDTLYPERDYAFSGFDAVAQAYRDLLGDPVETAQQMRALFDTPHRRRVFDQILEQRSPTANASELIANMVATYRAHAPKISLPEESVRVLAELSGSVRMGIITDGPAQMQRAKLKALGLAENNALNDERRDPKGAVHALFEVILVTDELGPAFAKPRSAAFELMAERLGVAHAACAYVADNPAKDFVAPNALGWLSIRVIREGGVYVDAEIAPGGAPQVTIHGLKTLPQVLDRMNDSRM